jgi:PAS domain S-box-containing protein
MGTVAGHEHGHNSMITHEILDGIGDAIYALGADWRISFMNRQAERFFARDRRELVGRDLWDSFPAARGTELGAALEDAMDNRKAVHLDLLSPSTGRWTDTRIFPLASGGLVASWRDITEQKQQQNELAEAVANHQRAGRELRTLVNSVPAMIAYWNEDLKCRYANDKYLEWFGRTREDMISLKLQNLLGEALFLSNEPFIRGALAGKPQSFERTLRKPSGQIGHTWTQYIPDVDADGRVHGFYAMATDVGPLKDAEERLKEVNTSLRLARQEAEEATAVKSVFLSNMSHELRNPLTGIIGYAELLAKRGTLDEAQRKYVGRIHDASMALLTTVNDVLDFSKLEAGQVGIERRPMDPLALGRQALEMFELEMEKKGLAHRFEGVQVPALVLADPTRVRQILTNLIGNAVKFTTSGSVAVRCLYDGAARMLRYEVVDTGPGIPPDRIGRLFQRFSQVDASTNRVFGGTGLGLAICKGLAEAMGGAVGVLSMPGEGSCFWVQIPSEPAPTAAYWPEDLTEALAEPDGFRGRRLLVVDDEPFNRDLVRQMLEPLGVSVTEAQGGAAAVAAARSADFDLILMDIQMPEIDGPTAAQLIRSIPGWNVSTAIVALSAEVVREMPPAWRGLFDSMLVKPLLFTDLTSLLGRSPSSRARPSARSSLDAPATAN